MAASRRKWKARTPKYVQRLEKHLPFVFIHHEAGPVRDADLTVAEECEVMRQIQRSHMEGRGYRDIGYNFVIFPSGRSYEGRGFGVLGGHTEGRNHQGYGICFAGNYVKQRPTKAALDECAALIRYGIRRKWIRKDVQLFGHRDAKATACPGGYLYKKVDCIEEAI